MKSVTYQWIIGILLLSLGFIGGFGISEKTLAGQVVINQTNIQAMDKGIEEIKNKLEVIDNRIINLISNK